MVDRKRIYSNAMSKRHGGIAIATKRSCFRGWRPVRSCSPVKTSKIIETDLWLGICIELRRSVGVEVTQQPITKPMVWENAQLLLNDLDSSTECRASGQSFVEIKRTEIKADRK